MVISYSTSVITYVLLFGSIVVFGIVGLFLYSAFKREKDFEEKERQAFQKYEDVLSKASNRAASVIDSTTANSGAIINQTKVTNEKLEENLDRTLQEVAKKHVEYLNNATDAFQKDYEKYLVELQKNFHQQAEATLQKAEETINHTIESFSTSLLGKTLGAQEVIDVKIQTLLADAEKETQTYKKMQLEKVDAQITQLIHRTYEEVLKRSIPETLQHELIIESLEKAKKEGLFNI